MERPSPKESDEDLIRQNESFKEKTDEKLLIPAAKVVGIGKRKSEEGTSVNSSINYNEAKMNDSEKQTSKPKSRFSQSRAKKKKEGYVDNTILLEAASKEKERNAVLKPIIERNVPALSPFLAQWHPTPCPGGFPQVPKLNLAELMITENSEESYKKKSLYMRYIEKETSKMAEVELKKDIDKALDENLTFLGSQSYILDGNSGLGKTEEAFSIHVENMKKLSMMTHEERLMERDELIGKLSDDQLKFLLSLRKKREEKAKESVMQMEEEEALTENVQESMDEGSVDKSVKQGTETAAENQDDPDISLFELPIPPDEAKNWIHMDKIELEKLKWMTNVPVPKPLKGKEGYVARFSFEGDLLPYDSDISWRKGLHHHGDEPGRAGYSLDELFLFVRSKVVQQRHLGLKTLGNILRNASEGFYDASFDVPIIQLMVDAGVVLLLRFAMDEASPLVYKESLRALYYLISSEPDERCLALSEPLFLLGGAQPGFSSQINSKEKDREELDAEEKELKDVEVIKLDIIRALVRMDVHIRLRYFLESVTLSPPDVVYTMGILKRITRHSLTAAWTLVRTPRLIATIVQHFLPHSTSQLFGGKNIEQLTSVYGVPFSHALSFLKVLASRGRQIATTLLEDYDLISRIMAYASLEPTDTSMPLPEVLTLSQETYCLWSVFLSYGLRKSQHGFSTFYPMFIKQLLFYRDKVDINEQVGSNYYNYEIGAHMGNVLTKGLCVASTKSLLESRMKNSEASVESIDGKNLVLQPPVLDWNEFSEIYTQVELCLAKWLSQLGRCSEVSFSGFKLMGSFCNFVIAYIEKWRDQKTFDSIKFMNKLKSIESIIKPVVSNINWLTSRLRSSSALCSSLKLGVCRDTTNLGSLWSVCEEGKVTPLLQEDSPFLFLLPFTNLLKVVTKFYPAVNINLIQSFLNDNHLTNYFKKVCTSRHTLSNQWFTRIEIYTITNILQLASLKGCSDLKLFHETALTILPLVHKGDEFIARALITDVICIFEFTSDISDIEAHMDSLTITEYKALKSPAIHQPILSVVELTKKLHKVIPAIGKDLVKNLLHSKLLEKSSLREKCIPFLINDLTLDREEEVAMIDHYWSLYPLKMLLLLSDAKGKELSNQSQPETISSVTKWLQMTFFLLKYRRNATLTHTQIAGWFRHLCNIFLAFNDLFLDANINSYTQAILFTIFENDGFKKIDPSWTCPDLQPWYDWYKRMIEQFASVSYGDSTFALCVVLPLLRNWPKDYKLTLFGDSSDALPFIRLSADEVSQFIPLEHFLSPVEEDKNIIIRYRSAIRNRLITKERTPFLYEFTMHHITSFIDSM